MMDELNEREAAAELRVSVSTLQRERAEGKIAYVRRRRRVLYPRECIEEYKKSQIRREKPTSIPSALPKRTYSKERVDAAARWARRIGLR